MPDPTPTPTPTPDGMAAVLARLDTIAGFLADLRGGSAVAPEGLSGAEAARFVGVSPAKWYELNNRGLCPGPAMVGDGHCPRWRRSELLAWMGENCPSRAKWQHLKAAAMRRAG